MTPKLDLLLAYVRDNSRICPQPTAWQRLYDMLPERKVVDGKWMPGRPLIGADWHGSNDTDKVMRLIDHIEWAKTHGVFPEVNSFLRALAEKDWYHGWD